jgi:hypothetical protein
LARTSILLGAKAAGSPAVADARRSRRTAAVLNSKHQQGTLRRLEGTTDCCPTDSVTASTLLNSFAAYQSPEQVQQEQSAARSAGEGTAEQAQARGPVDGPTRSKRHNELP